jgi:hypothetical protein
MKFTLYIISIGLKFTEILIVKVKNAVERSRRQESVNNIISMIDNDQMLELY